MFFTLKIFRIIRSILSIFGCKTPEIPHSQKKTDSVYICLICDIKLPVVSVCPSCLPCQIQVVFVLFEWSLFFSCVVYKNVKYSLFTCVRLIPDKICLRHIILTVLKFKYFTHRKVKYPPQPTDALWHFSTTNCTSDCLWTFPCSSPRSNPMDKELGWFIVICAFPMTTSDNQLKLWIEEQLVNVLVRL